MEPMTNLQQLVTERLRDLGGHHGPLSTRAAAARSGGLVSYETLRKIVAGTHSGKITNDVGQGIAQALRVAPEVVFAAAGHRGPAGKFDLPDRADRLTQRERVVVLSVMDAILDAAAREGARERPAEGPGLRAVARRRGTRLDAPRDDPHDSTA